MKKILLSITFITIIAISFHLFFVDITFAQSPDDLVKVYVSDSCPYCQELLKTLEEQDLLDTVEVIEISQEPYSSEFRAVVEECQVKSAVPLLYDGERCFQGQYTAIDRVYAEQGVDPIEDNIGDPNNNLDQTTEIESDEILSQDLEDQVIPDRSPSTKPDQTEETEPNSLSEKVFGTEVKESPPDIPPLNIIVMLIAPITLIGLGYYIITKMKV